MVGRVTFRPSSPQPITSDPNIRRDLINVPFDCPIIGVQLVHYCDRPSSVARGSAAPAPWYEGAKLLMLSGGEQIIKIWYQINNVKGTTLSVSPRAPKPLALDRPNFSSAPEAKNPSYLYKSFSMLRSSERIDASILNNSWPYNGNADGR